MRMAMSCFAFPETGRPTLRERRSSASVDSGMSDRSSLLSGIGFALFACRLARADDANDFFVIFQPPGHVYDDQNPTCDRSSQTLGEKFTMGVLGIVQSRASGSPKTVAASSKDTPCFFRLLRAFRASQENTLLYIR